MTSTEAVTEIVPTMRVLCVDDEPAIRLTIQAYLQDLGHHVETASNGREALALIAANQYDAVLLDLAMPELSGLDVLKQVAVSHPGLPLLVVSGTGNIREVISALRLGAWDFITKPMEDMAILMHSLQKSVERSRLIRENQQHRERLEALVAERTQALREEIRERTAVEEALRASLHEKEVLLKEVHHRVKNNLQIVSSLLSLQALRFEDELAAPFLDSQARIRAMALVHEKLYRAKDLSRIDFSAYLRQLAVFLMQAYSPKGKKIASDIDCEEFYLSVDLAIPCGLVLNELLTNSLKHAFKGLTEGRISIHGRTKDGMATLSVSDDGAGLPEGFDIDAVDSLGLQLVSNLTRQLKGRIEANSGEKGASFTLHFPIQAGG